MSRIRRESFGVQVDLDVPDLPALTEHLWWVLPPEGDSSPGAESPQIRVRATESGDGFRLTATTGVDRHYPTPLELATAIEIEVRHYVALMAPNHIFFHAGTVALDGGAIIIPGYSTSGKSTLVHALLRAGCGYLSDEYAVIDERGLVSAYPRPVSLRRGNVHRHRIEPSRLGATLATSPLPPRAILTMPYVQGDAPHLSPARSVGAVMALMNNAVAARARPDQAMRAASTVARQADYWRGTRGEADTAAGWIVDHLRRDDTPRLVVPGSGDS